MLKKFCSILLLCAFAAFLLPMSAPLRASAASSGTMQPAGNANLHVIDIAKYNVPTDSSGNADYGAINWSTVARNTDAIYIKATSCDLGYNHVDPYYTQFAASAKAAHISYGFYHYFLPYRSLALDAQEADYFYNAVKNIGYDCTPVLDAEVFDSEDGSAAFSKSEMTAAIQAFIDEFKKKSGLDVMIYTSYANVNTYFGASLSHYKFWMADFSGTTRSATSVWNKWDMLQYTGNGSCPGFPVTVDNDTATSNIFLGSVSGLVCVDKPKGSVQAGGLVVSGWTISHYGTSRVDVYIDNKYMGTAWQSSFGQRPDVENIYGGSGYDDALDSGFNVTIPDTLANGAHTLRVAALNDRGNAVWSSSSTFTYVVPPQHMSLDTPQKTYTGDIPVYGWAVSHYGVSRADVYVDGRFTSSFPASSFSDRSDIERLYGGKNYQGLDHSGFSGTIAAKDLSGGTHTLRVAQIDKAGHAQWSVTRTFSVAAPAQHTTLDLPNGSYSGAVPVGGWAISHYGVKRVDLYVDGKFAASVPFSAFTARADVGRAFANQGYDDPAQSGFYTQLPAGSLAAGKHSISAVQIDNRGHVLWSSARTFTVIK